MGHHLNQAQQLEQKIELSQSLRMSIRLELAHRLGGHVQSLLSASNDAPEKLYDRVCVRVVEILTSLFDSTFAVGVGERLMNATMKRRSIAHPSVHAHVREAAEFRAFVVDCIIDENQGHVRLETGDIIESTRGAIQDAFADPQKLKEKIRTLTRLSGLTDPTEGAEQELREGRNALRIHEALSPLVENIAEIYRSFVHRVVDLKRQQPFPAFFRDIVIEDRLQFLVSEKILRAFSKNVLAPRGRELVDGHEDVLLRAIGAFVLASMGIIHRGAYDWPCELETLGLLQGEDAQTRVELGKAAADDPLVVSWRKKTGGTLFLHAWQRTGTYRVTPENVRRFLAHTVERDRQEILETLNAADFFRRAQEILEDSANRPTVIVRLRELLMEVFDREEFRQYLTTKIRGDWYAALDTFFYDPEEELGTDA